MIDERNRQRMKEALVKPFGAPRHDLERLALGAIEQRTTRRPARPAVALAVFLLFMVVAVSIALAARVLRPASQIVGSPQQSIVFDQLRQRPWNLPALAADGSCPTTTLVTKDVSVRSGIVDTLTLYGTGPVYGEGGVEVRGKRGYYYGVRWLSDPSYNGPTLVRGRKLDGSERVVFSGALAGGKLVMSDSLPAVTSVTAGGVMKFYDELRLPAGTNRGLWRQWSVLQGVPGPGCYGFQMDGPSFQEIGVVFVPQGG